MTDEERRRHSLKELAEKAAPIFRFFDDGHPFESAAAIARMFDERNRCRQALEDAAHAVEAEPDMADAELESAGALVNAFYVDLFGPPPPDEALAPQQLPVSSEAGPEDDSWRTTPPSWRFASLDRSYPRPWDGDGLAAFLAELHGLECATWMTLLNRQHSHAWDSIDPWVEAAKRRVEELELDDRTGWVQIQTGNMPRILGFRTGNVLNLLWWDRFHEIYKTKGR